MRFLTLTSALALGLALSGGAFAQTASTGCTPKARNTQGYPQGLNNSSQPHPRFTAGEQTGVDSGNRARLTAGGGGIPGSVQSSEQPHPRFTAGEQTGVDNGNRARLTAGGGGMPGSVQSSEQPHPRFTAGEQTGVDNGNRARLTAGEQTGVDSGNRARLTAGGGGIPGSVQSSEQPHPRFTAGQQQYAQAGTATDPCK